LSPKSLSSQDCLLIAEQLKTLARQLEVLQAEQLSVSKELIG
jgi:hypothetical protein